MLASAIVDRTRVIFCVKARKEIKLQNEINSLGISLASPFARSTREGRETDVCDIKEREPGIEVASAILHGSL